MAQYLFYQHNVQQFFRSHLDKYSGVIIPLSIAVSFPTGTYGFIRALCARDATKRYAIDPRTPLFQWDWDRARNVRDPHIKVAEVLGEPFPSIGLVRALVPSDFGADEIVQDVTKRCLAFQKDFRQREEEKRKLKKYMTMLGLESLGPLDEPQFLIPPYFMFRQMEDDWYQVNTRCVQLSVAHSAGIDIRPVLHFDNCASVGDVAGVSETLRDLGIAQVILYPNDFREHEVSQDALLHCRRLCSEFADGRVTPHAMHGGYFAMLLSKFGLAGFANGVGYGEWRNSRYHRGGTAVVRVYVLKLHRYVGADEAQTLVDANPEYFAEDTELFAEVRESGRRLNTVTLAEALDHFMVCRQIEQEAIDESTTTELAAELSETVEHLEEISPLVSQKYGESLARWQAVLETP